MDDDVRPSTGGAEQWQQTLWFTAIAQTLSILGFSFAVPFLPLFIQDLGVHGVAAITLWAAILSGGSAIGMAITAPIWGVLADRYGRKIMVVRAMFSAALLIALMGLTQNIWELLALRMLQGMFTGTVSASQAMVASQSPKERLGFSLGIMQTAVFLGNSMGPLVGGLVAEAVGFRVSFVAGGTALLMGGLLVAFKVREESRFAEQRGAPRPRVLESMRDATRIPALMSMIGAIFVVQFGITVVFPILPQFVQMLQGSAGHAALATGVILTCAGIAGAIASVSVGALSDRIGYKAILVSASLVAAVLSIPQYFVGATWQLVVLRTGVGFALGAVQPAASAVIATLTPPEKRGAAYGLSGSATSFGIAAGPLTAAGVVAVAGIRPVFLTAAVLLGAIAFWVATLVHIPEEMDEEPASTEEPASAVAAAGSRSA